MAKKQYELDPGGVSIGAPEQEAPKHDFNSTISYYENKIINDARFQEADETSQKHFLSNLFDKYIAPEFEKEGYADPEDMKWFRDKYVTDTYQQKILGEKPIEQDLPSMSEQVPGAEPEPDEPQEPAPAMEDPKGKKKGWGGRPDIPDKPKTSIMEAVRGDVEKYYEDRNWPSPHKKIEEYKKQMTSLEEELRRGAIDKETYDNWAGQVASNIGLGKDGDRVYVFPNEVDLYQEKVEFYYHHNLQERREASDDLFVKDMLDALAIGSSDVMRTPTNIMAISERASNGLMGLMGRDREKDATYWQERADLEKWITDQQRKNNMRYDQTITDYMKAGQMGHAAGATVLAMAENLPMLTTLIMGNAAGATNATLAFMGGSVAADEYLTNVADPDMDELTSIINALGKGFSEIVFESIGTVNILNNVRKAVAQEGVDVVTDQMVRAYTPWFQRNMSILMSGTNEMLQEGASEMATQLSQNILDIAAGRDVELGEGVAEAGIVGAAIGYGLATPRMIQQMGGRDKVVKNIMAQLPEDMAFETKVDLTKLIIEGEVIKAKMQGVADPIKESYKQDLAVVNQRIQNLMPKPKPEPVSVTPEVAESVRAYRIIEEDIVELGIKIAQKKFNLPETPDIRVSDNTEYTLDKIEKEEPVTNELLKEASDELYAEYKRLEAMKEADKRDYTIEQINDMQGFLEEEITALNNRINEQAEKGEFVTREVDLTDEITVSEIAEEGARPVAERVEEEAEREAGPKPEEPVAEPPPVKEAPVAEQETRYGKPEEVLEVTPTQFQERIEEASAPMREQIEPLDQEYEALQARQAELEAMEPTIEGNQELRDIAGKLQNIEDRVAKIRGPVQEELDTYIEQATPTIENMVREQVPEIEDAEVESIVDTAITKLSDPAKGEQDLPLREIVNRAVQEQQRAKTEQPIESKSEVGRNVRKMESEDVIDDTPIKITTFKQDTKVAKGREVERPYMTYDNTEDFIQEYEVEEGDAELIRGAGDRIRLIETREAPEDSRFRDTAIIEIGGERYTVVINSGAPVAPEAVPIPEKVIEEPTWEPVPPPKVDERTRDHNNLIMEVESINLIPLVHTRKRQEGMRRINRLASKLGYVVGQEGQRVVVTDPETGKAIKTIPIRQTQAQIQAHPALEDYPDKGFVSLVNDIIEFPAVMLRGINSELGPREIAQAARNIKEGKKTVAANVLLDYLWDSYKTGIFAFKEVEGQPAFIVDLARVQETALDLKTEDFINKYGFPSPDNVDIAVARGLMSEQDKHNLIDQYEQEAEQRERAGVLEVDEGEQRVEGAVPGGIPDRKGEGDLPRPERAAEPEIDRTGIRDKVNRMRDLAARLDFDQGQELASGGTAGRDARKELFDVALELMDDYITQGVTGFDAILSDLVPIINNPNVFKDLLPFLKQGYGGYWTTAPAEVSDQMDPLRAKSFSEADLDNLIAERNRPEEPETYDDLVGKELFIPSLGKMIRVDHIETWENKRDQQNPYAGGPFAAPVEFQPVTVAIVEPITNIEGATMEAIPVEDLRGKIKNGQVTEQKPYDNPKYREGLQKIADMYRSVGMLDKAGQYESRMWTEPTVAFGPAWSWEADIRTAEAVVRSVKRKADIQAGKEMFSPLEEVTPRSEAEVMALIESWMYWGEPVTDIINDYVSPEMRLRITTIHNLFEQLQGRLGLFPQQVLQVDYLKEIFAPMEVYEALKRVAVEGQRANNGRGGATAQSVENYVRQLNEALERSGELLERAKEMAFTWDVKNAFWQGKAIPSYTTVVANAKYWDVTRKDAIRDQYELALVQIARYYAQDATLSEADRYSQIYALHNWAPNISQTARTGEVREKQQFSTPLPISYLMGLYTNAQQASFVLDPSAGNGSLLIGGRIDAIRSNDLDSRRYQNLRAQGYPAYNRDSKYGVRDFVDVPYFPVIHHNPPFGGPKEDYGGYKLTGEYVTVAHTLESLADTGKAAIIVGGHVKFKDNGQMAGKDLTFFNWLYKHFNVEDVIQLDGDMYKKMGSAYPIKMILINGRKANPEGAAPLQNESFDPINDYAELHERITEQITKPDEQNILQPAVDANRGTDSLVGNGDPVTNPDRDPTGPDPVVEGEGDRPAPEGGPRGDTVPVRDEAGPDPGEQRRRTDQADTGQPGIPLPEGGTQPEGGARPSLVGALRPTRDPSNLPVNNIGKPTERTQRQLGLSERTGDEVTPYVPLSRLGSGGYVVPATIAVELENALLRLKDSVGDIDEFVRSKLKYNSLEDMKGKLFAEQVDSIGQAIHNIEGGNAMIIGHQTGTGKGRIAAATIRYAIENGKMPVFITKDASLFTDMYRDLVDIGSPDYQPFMMNKSFPNGSRARIMDADGNVVHEVKPSENDRIIGKGATRGTQELPEGTDMVFTTYSQFTTEGRDDAKRAFLNSLAQREDVVFIMDESHDAAGMSNTGEFFMDWLQGTGGGLFLSATYAKRPDNMPLYAMKTVLREANLDYESLVEAIKQGGTALQEMITLQLTESGQFSKLGFKMDAEINYMVIGDTDNTQRSYNPELGEEMVAKFDQVTGVIQEIIEFQSTHIKPVIDIMDEEVKGEGQQVGERRGTTQAGVDNQPFFSRVWNIIDQLLLASKVKEALPFIIEDLQAGRKPVIALKSTMEAMFDQMVEAGTLQKGDSIDLDFSHVLRRGLDTVMKYTVKDEMGNPSYETLAVDELSEAGRNEYYRMMEKIQGLSTGIPVTPIDILRRGIADAGFDTVEITGRGTMFEMSEDMTRGTYVNNTKPNKIEAVSTFNNNRGVAAIINRSGSTGLSMHSSPKFKDTSQRTMYILQNDLDINVVVQTLGRVYRADQLNKPIYNILTSQLPAEKRAFMMNAKKLKSLDANTSGNQKQSKSIVDVPDYMNKYGDLVVFEFLKENPMINFMLGELVTDFGDRTKAQDLAKRMSGRVQILRSEMQEQINNEIIERYDALIQYLNDTGTNDLMVTSEDLKAKILESQVTTEGSGGVSAFSEDTVLNTADVQVTRKPLNRAELVEAMDAIPDTNVEDTRAEMERGIDEKLSEKLQAIEDDYAARREVQKKKIMDKEGVSTEEKQRQWEIKKADMDASEANRVQGEKDIAENNKNTFRILTDYFYKGKGLYIPMSEQFDPDTQRMSEGVFLGFEVDTRKPNPWVKSNFMLKFATLDKRKIFKIPASKEDHIRMIMGHSNQIDEQQSRDIVEDWDNRKRTRNREKRHIVTQNVLQGMGNPAYRNGRLIQFTYEDGTVGKGILLPESWIAPKDNSLRMPVERAESIIRNLPPYGFIQDTSHMVTIKKRGVQSPQLYEVRVPAARKRGGKYYMNADLKAFMEYGDFEQAGNEMVGIFTESNLKNVLGVLKDKFNMQMEVPNITMQRGMDTTDSYEAEQTYGTYAPPKSPPRRGQPNPNNATIRAEEQQVGDRVRPEPKTDGGLKPKKQWEIVFDLGSAVGYAVRQAKPSRKRKVIGTYSPATGRVLVKWMGDLDTTAHEIGHAMDDLFGMTGTELQGETRQAVQAELSQIWDYGSKPDPKDPNKLQYQMQEGMAEFIRAWLVNPREAEARYPNTHSWFMSRIARDPDTLKGLEQFSEDLRVWWGASIGERLGTQIFTDDPSEKLKPKGPKGPKYVYGTIFNHESPTGQFRVTHADRFAARFTNFLRPLESAYGWAMREQGIDVQDPSQISPLENFNIMSRLLLGADVKMRNAWEKGLVTKDGKRIISRSTGEPLSFHLLLSQIPNHTWKDARKNMEVALEYGMAERIVEIPWKLAARQMREDFEAGGKIPHPSMYLAGKNIYRQPFPTITSQFAAKIEQVEKQIEAGKITEEDAYHDNDRYDFREQVITGLGTTVGRLQNENVNDYDLAREIKAELNQMKTSDPDKHKWITSFNTIYREISRANIEYARDAGLLSHEDAHRIKEENLNYMAMKRIFSMTPEDIVTGNLDAISGMMSTKPDPGGLDRMKMFEPVKGSLRPIRDPVEVLIESYMNVVRMGDTNTVVKTFADAFVPGKGGREARHMHDTGEDTKGKKHPKFGQVAWVSDKKEPNSITYWVDGQRQFLVLPDKELFRTMKELGLAGNKKENIIVTALKFFPQILRWTVVNNPVFAGRNVVRDLRQFLIFGKGLRFKYFFNPKNLGFKKMGKNPIIEPGNQEKRHVDSLQDLFETTGAGQFGYMVSNKRDYYRLQKKAMKKMAENRQNFFFKAGRGFGKAWDAMLKSEMATRLLQFRVAYRDGTEKFGMTHEEASAYAAYQARDLMDFMAGGTWIKELNKVIIFLNPTFRGLEKIFRSMKTGRAAAYTALKMIGWLGLPGLLNSLLMNMPWVSDEDREEYLNAPDYQRLMFDRIPIGGGLWLMIPRPFEPSVVAAAFQRLGDKMFLGEEEAFDKEFARSVADVLMPISRSKAMGGFSGLVAMMFNYDFFRKKHIIPPEDKDISVTLRNTEYASKFGKLVQRATKADARMVDAFIQSQFSYWGNAWLKLTEAALPGEGVQKHAINPTMTGYMRYANAYAEPSVQFLQETFKKYPYTRDWDEYKIYKAYLSSYFADDAQQDAELRRERGSYLRNYANAVEEVWRDIDFEEIAKAQAEHERLLRDAKYNRVNP